MNTRLNRIERFRWLVIIIGLIISYRYFGNSFSFVISIIFIMSIAFFFIRDMDVSGALSGITVLAPVVKTVLQGTFLKDLNLTYLIEKTNSLLQTHGINHIVNEDEVDTVIVYLLMFSIIWLFDNKDKSALGKHAEDDDPEFRDKSFAEKNEAFCKHLAKRINDINTELNWNSETYVPIAADVEMHAGKKIRRYDDMLKCLKEGRKNTTSLPQKIVNKVKFSIFGKIGFVNKAINTLDRKFVSKRIYLVLGDPGSGKSVSLRKLCSDLLEEARATGKTPVYINLKTWTDKGRQWSNSHLPTRKDLIAYVRNELYSEGDQFTDGFLNKYFEKMLENGRWYFIFDSFDEMPCLMSGERNAELIRHISKLIYDFLSSTNQSGGIIASRLYNRPAGTLNQTYTLTLQKFSDNRIRTMIKQYMSGNVDTFVLHLFKERPDLVTICRNPFHLSLLINYAQKHNDRLPDNQYELFKDFIFGRLTECKYKIEEQKLSIDEIYDAAILMAVNMQNHRGLDYPVERLLDIKSGLNKSDWEKRLYILEYIKLCRLGGNRQVVSFVHRRFQEFFYVEAMLNGTVAIDETDYAGVLNNTGIRDALVLYSQIGDSKKVQSIIEYCCNAIENNIDNINNIRNEGCVHFVNALYFLTEAFGYRKELLGEKIKLIAGLNEYLVKETDYIVQMAIVNSISLLSAEDIQKTVLIVFGLNNRWLNAAVVNNCKVIKKLNHDEEISFCWHFYTLPYGELLKNFFNIDFSLSLSECFSYVRFVHGTIPIFSAGVVIYYILFILDSKIFALFAQLWKQFSNPSNLKSIKEIIILLSEPSVKNVDQILTLRNNHLLLEMGLCSLVVFINMCLLLIENMTINDLFKSVSQKIGDLNRTDREVRTHGINETMLSKRFWINLSYLIISSVVMMKPDIVINQQYWNKAIRIFILGVTLAGFVIELIAETKEPTLKLAKRIKDTILHKNLFKLVLILLGTILSLIKKASFGLILLLMACLSIALLFTGYMVIPTVICILLRINITMNRVLTAAGLLCAFLMIIAFLIGIIMAAIMVSSDLIWINKHSVDKISRIELEMNLDKLSYNFIKRKYLQSLINRDTKLEGEWPGKQRKVFEDDVINRNLALLDCKEYSLDDLFSNGF